ncbi:hypothetical protein [uncultured Litoreibacter sp.]|uniref:hypothetical protein n=1 Tax=uncultured Litoreibacter sp. TaxID=1392394 RepID=UPI0026173535|nr:hypothetical protein [uncultured Litoreibacter sp.]
MKALIATLILTTTSAQAFCPQLNALFHSGKTMVLPPPFNHDAKCTTSLALSGETSTHCAWPFDYRAPEATQAFEAVMKAVPSCLLTVLEVEYDQDVNHPDFYDLRIFNAPQGQVGVSLKDKGGLQQTYVFLRVTPAS